MIDFIRYKKYATFEHFIILFDKIDKTFCIHSKDESNHVGMVTGFALACEAIDFATTRVKSIEKSSIEKADV